MGRRKAGALPILKPDGSGQYYREIGWKPATKEGTYRQHRFYLGSDKVQALIRYVALDAIWAGVEKRWQREHETPRPVWDEVTLQIGATVARGEYECRLTLPEWATTESDAATQVHYVEVLQVDFPSVRLALADDQLQAEGDKVREEETEDLIAQLQQRQRQRNTHQRLYGALDAFGEYLRAKHTRNDGRLTSTGETALKEVNFIKEHSKDILLCDLDNAALELWEDYWTRRPKTKRNTICAINTCKAAIVRIRAFLRWLHRAKDWAFRLPDDYEPRPVKIKPTQQENANRAAGHQVATFTDDQLVTLWRYAQPHVRLYILLALNCGFNVAELATLDLAEIQIDKPHRKYGSVGSWIMRIRNKSQVYGEWELWSETVEALRWYLSVRPRSSSSLMFVDKTGSPILNQTSSGSCAQRIPKAFDTLVAKIRQADATFPDLSFGKLRKTACQLIEEVSGSGETAGYFQCHGQPVPSDTLLDFYRNRDFQRVHDALKKVRSRLSPMFAAVNEPFLRSKRKTATLSREVIGRREKIVQLRKQGMTLEDIATAVGLSFSRVQKYLALVGVRKPKKQR